MTEINDFLIVYKLVTSTSILGPTVRIRTLLLQVLEVVH